MKQQDRLLPFTWEVSDFGYVLDAPVGPRKVPHAIFLRPARNKGDWAGIWPDSVRRGWEQRLQAVPITTPFYGVTHERLKAEKSVERPVDFCSYSFTPRDLCTCKWHSYTPLQESTGLFREFGALPAIPEGILWFANSYGNLLGPICPILVWHEEILAMQRAQLVWAALQKKDIRKLRNHFLLQSWPPSMVASRDLPPGNGYEYKSRCLVFDSHPNTKAGSRPPFPDRRATEPISWNEFPRDQWDSLINEIDVVTVAKAYLRQVIDQRFSNYSTATASWIRPRTLTRIFWPRNLLGAIWLQFEQSMTGDKKYVTCECPGCGKWIELSPAVNRSDKRFCDDKCRQRAYQIRKRTLDE